MPKPGSSHRIVRRRSLRSRLRDWWRYTSEGKRELVKAAIVVALLGSGLGIYYQFGRPAWRGYKYKQAPVAFEKTARRDDQRGAVLALRNELAGAPGDPRVWRQAAALLGRIGSPEVLAARPNLERAEASGVGLRLALMGEALRFGEAGGASGGLAKLDKAGREDSSFYRLAAAVALASGRVEEFERQLEKLVQSDPGDLSAKFNLAALRLWSMDDATAARAYAEMQALTSEPPLRVRAALERMKYAAASRDPARVEAEVIALLVALDPAWRGREPERENAGEPAGAGALRELLQREASRDPSDTACVMRWLAGLQQGAAALAWLDRLPKEIRNAPEVASAEAELAARSNELRRLSGLLEGGVWGAIGWDTIELALAARVQRVRFGEARARPTWDDAVVSAGNSLSALRALARLGAFWQDREGTDRALQAVVERHAGEHWACEALKVSYATERDTEKLWRLYQLWAPRVPEHKEVQQTWVLLGALLNRSTPAQLRRAEDLLKEEGDAPETATVLAVAAARWRAGRATEAQRAIERLTFEKQNEPRVIMWRAVLAAGRDETEELDQLLALLPRDRLMREEQQVLANALAEHNRRKRAIERAAARAAMTNEAFPEAGATLETGAGNGAGGVQPPLESVAPDGAAQ